MYNINSGYVGSSRSVRSKDAINDYEVPISMIKKGLIKEFLNECDDFTDDEVKLLSNIATTKWKYVAKKIAKPSSWHHTSSFFNETNHYDLRAVARKILKIKDTIDKEYKDYLRKQKNKKAKTINSYKYGVICVEVWGGSRRNPKIIGYDEAAGIVIGKWLYYKDGHNINNNVSKYKISANKVEWFKKYNSYEDLIKKNVNYKGTKRVFNRLIKEKGV
ncbi:MAG: hypothetical protein ACOCRX_00940 [Candidatus Woesearchaeota archaeon]